MDEGGDDPVWLGGGATVSFERKVIPHWVTVRVLDEDEGVRVSIDGKTPPHTRSSHT